MPAASPTTDLASPFHAFSGRSWKRLAGRIVRHWIEHHRLMMELGLHRTL